MCVGLCIDACLLNIHSFFFFFFYTKLNLPNYVKLEAWYRVNTCAHICVMKAYIYIHTYNQKKKVLLFIFISMCVCMHTYMEKHQQSMCAVIEKRRRIFRIFELRGGYMGRKMEHIAIFGFC